MHVTMHFYNLFSFWFLYAYSRFFLGVIELLIDWLKLRAKIKAFSIVNYDIMTKLSHTHYIFVCLELEVRRTKKLDRFTYLLSTLSLPQCGRNSTDSLGRHNCRNQMSSGCESLGFHFGLSFVHLPRFPLCVSKKLRLAQSQNRKRKRFFQDILQRYLEVLSQILVGAIPPM